MIIIGLLKLDQQWASINNWIEHKIVERHKKLESDCEDTQTDISRFNKYIYYICLTKLEKKLECVKRCSLTLYVSKIYYIINYLDFHYK